MAPQKSSTYVQRKKCSTCKSRKSTALFAPGSPTCVGCRQICKGCFYAPCVCIKDYRKKRLHKKILLCQERDYPLMTILQKKCHERNLLTSSFKVFSRNLNALQLKSGWEHVNQELKISLSLLETTAGNRFFLLSSPQMKQDDANPFALRPHPTKNSTVAGCFYRMAWRDTD